MSNLSLSVHTFAIQFEPIIIFLTFSHMTRLRAVDLISGTHFSTSLSGMFDLANFNYIAVAI